MAGPLEEKSRFACTDAGGAGHLETHDTSACDCAAHGRLTETKPEDGPEFAPGSIEELLFGPQDA